MQHVRTASWDHIGNQWLFLPCQIVVFEGTEMLPTITLFFNEMLTLFRKLKEKNGVHYYKMK